MTSSITRLGRRLPGLAVLIGGAGLAVWAATSVPYITGLILAILIGTIVGNTVGVPPWARPGIGLHSLFLKTGIVLLGAQVALGQLFDSGPRIVLLAVGTVALGVVYVELLARWVFTLRAETGSLLAAGSSVCGVSAVVAVAGSINADEADIAYVAATILLFDALTILVVPPIGTVLGLTDRTFGIWAGLSMFSTGPVTAAGFAYSEVAGQWATLTKLVRNSLIGFVAVGYSLYYARRTSDSTSSRSVGRAVWYEFPKFLFGFLLLMVMANLGLLASADVNALGTIADWLFLLAFVGLGFDIRLSTLRSTGVAPVVLVSVYLLTVGIVTLLGAQLIL